LNLNLNFQEGMITAESSSATNPINALALLLIESRATRQRLGINLGNKTAKGYGA
jgi:hypothetical protein